MLCQVPRFTFAESSFFSSSSVTYQLIPERITPEERRRIPSNLAFDPMLDRQKLDRFKELTQEMTQFTTVSSVDDPSGF